MSAPPQPASGAHAKRRSAADGLWPRIGAVLVLLAVVAILAAMHWDDLFAPERSAQPAADDPVARCLAARAADIDKMRADGVIDEAQATLFTSRAEALCQAQFGAGAGPPAAGGLPAQ